MTVFFRVFQHLLPDALALRIKQATRPWFIGDGSKIGEAGLLIGGRPGGRIIDRFWQGLTGTFVDARQFIDLVNLDLRPATTRQLPEFEFQFGIEAAVLDTDRRANIDAEWKSTGGQSPSYLQGVMRAAGFDIFIHEWFDTPGDHDPRPHTTLPGSIGSTQCGEPLALCGEPNALCDNFVSTEPGYLVNKDLTGTAPPPIPDDPNKWRYFLYWGAETFPTKAQIPATRRDEFERKLLKICPEEQWLVMLVDFV